MVTAVAVWDHQPTAAELLAHRLAAGWRPMPSLLAKGPQVVGFASRVPRDQWEPV